jgi:hypothetical protein
LLQIALQGETSLFNIVMSKEDTFGLHVTTQLMKVPELERDDLMAKINNIFNVKKTELSQRQESLVPKEPNDVFNVKETEISQRQESLAPNESIDDIKSGNNIGNFEINNTDIVEISAPNNTANAVDTKELQNKPKRKKRNKKGKLLAKQSKKIKLNLLSF